MLYEISSFKVSLQVEHYDRREIWKMMREHVDLSEKEKLEQLHAMVVNSSWLDDDKPCEEFKELLSSLPVESVIVFPRTPYLVRPRQYQSRSFLRNIPLFPR